MSAQDRPPRRPNTDAGTPPAPKGSPRPGSPDAHSRGNPVEILGVPAPVFVSGHRDERVAAIAGRQRGIVTRDQLRAAGIGGGVVTRMARTGQLHRLHRGVFAVGHEALPPFARETAALLAVGEGAYLSHVSAARVWGILPAGGAGELIDVLRHPGRAHARSGIRLHETSHLEQRDIRTFQGLPVTSAARTLLDLAEVLDWPALERALAEAWGRKRVSESSLRDVLERAGGRRGAPRLATLAGFTGQRLTDSDGERRLLALLRRAGLPLPLTQARLHGFKADFYWPQHGLVLELDSHLWHSSRWAFERDRRKTATLTAAGLTVMRESGAQLAEEPLAVVARIAQALAHSRAA